MKKLLELWLLLRPVAAAVVVVAALLSAPLAVRTNSGEVLFGAAGTANAQPGCSPSSRADSLRNMAHFVESHPEVQKMLGDAWRQSTPQERRAAISAYLARHPQEGGACGR